MKETITFDRFVRMLGTGLIVLFVVWLINHLSNVLLPFAIAWVVAYLLYPMVRFVQYRLHVPGRALSIIVTLTAVTSIIVFVLWLIIPPMIEQFQKLGDLTADYVHEKAQVESIPETVRLWVAGHQAELQQFVRSSGFTTSLSNVLTRIASFVGQTATILMSVVTSLIALLYMFFILLDYEYLTDAWLKIFPPRLRPFWQGLAKDAERELSHYIRGQTLVATTMGILFCIGFTIIDFPMAIGLGILIGILDMVPYLHTFALIPTAMLALLKAADTGQNFWVIFAMAIAVFIIVQIIIDMIVTPKIMGSAMGLNPAILLLSLSIWGALLGFIGLIIALPLTTLLMAYYERYITRDTIPSESENDIISSPQPS